MNGAGRWSSGLGVTYTTTGYGDLVLPIEFRLIGGVEALNRDPDVRVVDRLLLRDGQPMFSRSVNR